MKAYIKKTTGILVAIITSLFVVEVITRSLIGYPAYSNEKLYWLNKEISTHSTESVMPHKRIWSVEGGITVTELNNLGLPGNDVDTNNSKYIFILGNSFVESAQMQQNKTSTAILQDMLKKSNNDYQVLNLGKSAADLYTLFFRSIFYSRNYEPEIVIYVVESLERMKHYFERHEGRFNFEIPEYLGSEYPIGSLKKIRDKLRIISAYANLVYNSFEYFRSDKINSYEQNSTENEINKENVNNEDLSVFINQMKDCLTNYKKYYRNKFKIVSICSTNEENKIIKEISKELDIDSYLNTTVLNNNNQIKSYGHLNESGNKELGIFLYYIVKEQYEKQKHIQTN